MTTPAVTESVAPDARYRSSSSWAVLPVFTGLLLGCMGWAWMMRDYRYLQAESGLGYTLGILGVTLMVLLLLYPLGKRWAPLQRCMKLKYWFQMHMLLGVLGPLCILLHCNFQLGSANSTVALLAMLLVSGSGLVGRYFYGKFHYGLHGAQVEMRQIKADIDQVYARLAQSLTPQEQLAGIYSGCCDIIATQQEDVSYRRLFGQRRWLRKQKRLARRWASSQDLPSQALAQHYLALARIVDKLAGARLFERLFGLWHVFHMPVFLLMVVTAIVHIFVVHWY